MRFLRVGVVFGIVTALTMLALPVAAGGWWSYIDVDRSHVASGETVPAHADVMFQTLEQAEAARESNDFHAYLLRDVDRRMLDRVMSGPQPRRWWTPPAEMTLVGDVELSGWDANLAVATVDVVIPDVVPGQYALMFCDAGCVHPLADVVPLLDLEVSDSALAAQTANRLAGVEERLQTRIGRLDRELQGAERGASEATTAATVALQDVSDLTASVSDLEQRLDEATAAARQPTWPSYAGWFVAGFAVASAVAFLHSRSHRTTGQPATPIERAPDDARELVSSNHSQ